MWYKNVSRNSNSSSSGNDLSYGNQVKNHTCMGMHFIQYIWPLFPVLLLFSCFFFPSTQPHTINTHPLGTHNTTRWPRLRSHKTAWNTKQTWPNKTSQNKTRQEQVNKSKMSSSVVQSLEQPLWSHQHSGALNCLGPHGPVRSYLSSLPQTHLFVGVSGVSDSCIHLCWLFSSSPSVAVFKLLFKAWLISFMPRPLMKQYLVSLLAPRFHWKNCQHHIRTRWWNQHWVPPCYPWNHFTQHHRVFFPPISSHTSDIVVIGIVDMVTLQQIMTCIVLGKE